MRYSFWVFALSLLLLSAYHNLAQLKTANYKYIDTAFSYVGTTELTGHNDGYNVEKFLKSVGRKKGDSWCAAYVSYCLTAVKHPFKVRSGLARNFVTKQSILSSDVIKKIKKIEPGYLVIWQRGNTINGHVGFVVDVGEKNITTIEGNTSSGEKGAQADGDGVYIRKRIIQPYNYFRIKWFTNINTRS